MNEIFEYSIITYTQKEGEKGKKNPGNECELTHGKIICKKNIVSLVFVLFVCFRFFVPIENVSLIWRYHLYWWRAADFDLWPLSSEGSLACHSYCYTGHPFTMVISNDPWHSRLLPSIKQWSYHYMYLF